MIKEMAVDVPVCDVFTIENSHIAKSSVEENSLPSKTPKSQKMSTDEEEIENLENLENRCCFGVFNMITLLQLTALLNFVLDGICTYLGFHSIASYFFAFSSTGSLLCLCAIISAAQEEKRKMMAMTSIWVSLKGLVLGLLYIIASAAILDNYTNDDSFFLSLELVLLFAIIPFCLMTSFLQFQLTKKVVLLIEAKDEFYVIPSAHGSVEMRPSLRLYLAARKLSSLQNV
ncbi:hypothetical protein FO519_002665 [Halicephalobus sp. NKZ332]|nr:hypothetical protein FO519_002665 [Halicephalobus sp. NKZ332]